ncbi:MAG TPA: radical SAM family heme chaperone HemW [Bacteroidota bacterium]|nr:radical SAM family heme chaperone HemW [Bacteroidota bacterium]
MFGIYIHFPYCIHKCFYCDFYSVEDFSTINVFINSLLKEIEIASQYLIQSPPDIDTIYFGGGTPSLINPDYLEKILNQIGKFYKISDDTEITLEVNPGTIDQKYLADYKSLGINRLSIGVQSFIESELQFLQRIHTVQESINTFNLARKIGFYNISLDIIYNLPNQSINNVEYNINKVIELSAEHISAYSLIYESGTPLQKAVKQGKIVPLDEKIEENAFMFIIDKLEDSGYEQYEVSNFAKCGKKSRHNSKYWNYEPYIGFGPSAHSFIYPIRHWNSRSINKYIELLDRNKLPIQGDERITLDKEIEEKIMLGLRSGGIDIDEFSTKYQINIIHLLNDIYPNYDELIQISKGKAKLTKRGYLLSDEIILDLISKINNK